jgi:hypothetical protein
MVQRLALDHMGEAVSSGVVLKNTDREVGCTRERDWE